MIEHDREITTINIQRKTRGKLNWIKSSLTVNTLLLRFDLVTYFFTQLLIKYGQDITKTNVLSKFVEDWVKTVAV